MLKEFIRVPTGRLVAVIGASHFDRCPLSPQLSPPYPHQPTTPRPTQGRPLGMPTIDAAKAYRAFTVEPGGALDLRYVRVFRGKPVRALGRFARYYIEIRGGAVYVRLGGRVVITGCFFTVNPRLITEFLITQDQVTTIRLVGGYILQEGGALTVYVRAGLRFFLFGLVCVRRSTYVSADVAFANHAQDGLALLHHAARRAVA